MNENNNTPNENTNDNLNIWGNMEETKPNDGITPNNTFNANNNVDTSSNQNTSNSNTNISNNIEKNSTTIVDTPNTTTPINEETTKTNNQQDEKESTEPKYEEVEIKKIENPIRTDSYFDGKLLELFGWTILKNLITIVTLGIASPWAECMMLQFEIEHTVLNGKRLKFKGTGGSLFVERFKWVFLTIITLGIYSFWIPVKKTKWILSNIHFEDEEYVKEESYFDGKVLQLIGINILCNFLNCISFFILYPFTECIKLRWIAKHSIINRKKIVFDGKGLSLFAHYILWLFLTIITFGIYGFWLKIKMIKWKVKNSRLKLTGEEEKKDYSIYIMIVIFIVLSFIGLTILIKNPFDFKLNIENIFTGSQNETNQTDNYLNCTQDGYCCNYNGSYCEWQFENANSTISLR